MTSAASSPTSVPTFVPTALSATGDPAGAPRPDAPDDLPRRSFVEQVMGLPVSVHVRGPRARGARVEVAVERVFARLRADDAEFSTYREDSAVSRIRRDELTVADASPRLREVLALCDEASRRTDGCFSAWLPAGPGSADLVLDPSGLVKGWAAEEAFGHLVHDLADVGDHDVLLSAGGDVVVECTRTDTPDWQVAVADPRDPASVLRRIPLRAGAVATSGTTARGLHVRDPRTGGAANRLLSATVVGPDLLWADVYATALLVAGGPASWFDRVTADHAAILVDRDGHLTTLAR